MAEFCFETLMFEEKKESVRVTLLNLFYFDILKPELERIGSYKLKGSCITFNAPEQRAARLLNKLLSEGFKQLKNRLTGKPAVYIHKNSGIPLIGNVAFGLVDRNTSLIELKPITGCNLCCIHCSVNDKLRPVDFVVEKDYLINGFKELVAFKRISAIEAHISAQGDPLLYADLIPLIRDLRRIPEVKAVSIDTNGTLLSSAIVDKLIKAGLTRFNLSINAFEPGLAKQIAGAGYDIQKVLDIARYIAKKGSLIITPVLVPGVNEREIPKLIQFAKSINAAIGIQNFLNYRFGRNPVKQLDWQEFYAMLRSYEQHYGIKLILNESDFGIIKTKPLPLPLKKGDIVNATVVCNGRLRGEKIAVAENRSISVIGSNARGRVKLRIVRAKHNIFSGVTI